MKKIIIILTMLFITYQLSFSDDTNYGTVVTETGELGYNEIIDLPALSETSVVNAFAISTATLVSGGTTFVAAVASQSSASNVVGGISLTQPTYPRNISCELNFLSGTSTASVSGTMTIYGYDNKGIHKSEATVFHTTSTEGVGTTAWVYIETITLSGVTISNLAGVDPVNGTTVSTCTVRIGTSNKIGFWGDLRDNRDVYKVTANYVDISSTTYRAPASFIDTTYDTINLGTIGVIPDASTDFRIWYQKLKWRQ